MKYVLQEEYHGKVKLMTVDFAKKKATVTDFPNSFDASQVHEARAICDQLLLTTMDHNYDIVPVAGTDINQWGTRAAVNLPGPQADPKAMTEERTVPNTAIPLSDLAPPNHEGTFVDQSKIPG